MSRLRVALAGLTTALLALVGSALGHAGAHKCISNFDANADYFNYEGILLGFPDGSEVRAACRISAFVLQPATRYLGHVTRECGV